MAFVTAPSPEPAELPEIEPGCVAVVSDPGLGSRDISQDLEDTSLSLDLDAAVALNGEMLLAELDQEDLGITEDLESSVDKVPELLDRPSLPPLDLVLLSPQVELNVRFGSARASLGASICSITAEREWTAREVKAAVAAESGIPVNEQRLFISPRRLGPAGRGVGFDKGSELYGMRPIEPSFSSVSAAEIQLVRRPAEHARWLGKVAERGNILSAANSSVKKDREIALAAVMQNGRSLQFAQVNYRRDREVVLAAVKQDGYALRYASRDLRGDREIVMEAVQQNGMALDFAAGALHKDRDVVIAAGGQDRLALQFAVEELRADQEIQRIISEIAAEHARDRYKLTTLREIDGRWPESKDWSPYSSLGGIISHMEGLAADGRTPKRPLVPRQNWRGRQEAHLKHGLALTAPADMLRQRAAYRVSQASKFDSSASSSSGPMAPPPNAPAPMAPPGTPRVSARGLDSPTSTTSPVAHSVASPLSPRAMAPFAKLQTPGGRVARLKFTDEEQRQKGRMFGRQEEEGTPMLSCGLGGQGRQGKQPRFITEPEFPD